jgi:hypothetical protein
MKKSEWPLHVSLSSAETYKYLVLTVASNFVRKFGENLPKPLHTLYSLYRYTTRSLKISVEYCKNSPKFSTVALYLYAMHGAYVLKYFEILSTKL